MSRSAVAGLLLTGGASRRMGVDKTLLVVDGMTVSAQLGHLLAAACHPVIEVGPGHSGLPSVREDPPGEGPLAAIAAGAAELGNLGWSGPAIVLAADLPRLSAAVVRFLAAWPGEGAVLPVVGGRSQPLCARWAAADLAAAAVRVAEGVRAVRGLPGAGACSVVTEREWGAVARADAFADVDEPEDLLRLGISASPALAD